MIAYINDKGRVLAVFHTGAGGYRVYVKPNAEADFSGFANIRGKYKTRADAEAAMQTYVRRTSKDKSWKLCNDWSG